MNEVSITFIKMMLPLLIPSIIIIFVYLFFYKKIIGVAGEHHVKKELKKLPKDKYLIINNLMIEDNNTTHQIDHVVISPFGIFVIETKQYNGYITGNEYDKKWIQNKKYQIINPIHQNYGHIQSLKNILNIDEDKFISIVCIPSTAKINIQSKSHVLRLYELNKTISSYKENIVDNYEDINNRILELNISNDKNKVKSHIKHAKEISKQKEGTNLCPKCGGELVKRNSKYGEFIGCSNYPKCKYIKK